MRQFEDILGLRHDGISALSRRADDLLSTLDADERQQVCPVSQPFHSSRDVPQARMKMYISHCIGTYSAFHRHVAAQGRSFVLAAA